MQAEIIANPTNERKGIVTNPKYSINFVVQETPSAQGAAASGIIL